MPPSERARSTEPLYVQLCGGLRVSRGGEELDLGKTARQGRLALAYLLLNRDRAVSRSELMGRIWQDPDPQRVTASLSQTLSRLRQVLGRESVERLPGGAIRLRGPLRVDVEEAATSLREARRALDGEQWPAAIEQADSVLAHTAGVVLAGDDAEWLETVRREIDDLRADALELHAAAALRAGSPAEAEAAARRATDIDETRESAWALLMEAQAAHGSPAAATETFHRYRTRLGDVYGLTPSRRLIDLNERLLQAGAADEPTAPAAAARRPAFPAALASESGDEAFIGRERILATLREHYVLAGAGRRQVVLLCGEPGIGKTRLAAEFAREAHGREAIVLYGRSDAETLVPYQPFVMALERYISDCRGADFARELDVELAELSLLIPGLRRHVPRLRETVAVEPEMRRYRLFNAVVEVFAYVGRRRPMVLVLDDLHWGDTSTALLLKHLVHQLDDVKLLVLGTMRDDVPCRSDQLADFLARPQRGLERIGLTGLDRHETAAFVQARQGRGASEDAVGVLRRASGGNPLLLEETLKSVAESEPLGEGLSEAMVRRAEVPMGAKHVIDRRLERLAPGTRRVLSDGSVVGAEFDVRVLEAITEGDPGGVIRALEEAEAAGLVREVPEAVDRFSFSHVLVRDVLLEKQSGARLRRLRLRIGEALESVARSAEVNPAELAHHFLLAGHDNREAARKGLRYSIEAGDRAARSRAYEEAAGHYERASELLESEPEDDEARRCDLLLRIGRVQLRQGSAQARATFRRVSELALRHGLPHMVGEAALGFAPRYTEAGVVDEEAIALLRSALDALPGRPSALRAELMARLAETLHFADEEQAALALSEEALAMARSQGDARVLVAALESRHEVLLHVEHVDERLQLSQELLDLADRIGERELQALGHHWRVYDLLEAADVKAARREHQALDELARELRQPLYEHFSVGWEVVWAHMAGEMDRVEPLAARFRELGRRADARDTETIHRAQLIALRRREEVLPAFISTVEQAVEDDPLLLTWRAVLPLAHLAAGRVREAVDEYQWLAHDGFGRVRRDMFWFATMCVLAETCALLGDDARARSLYDALLPYRHRNVQVTQAACWGSSERFLGLLAAATGAWNAAEGHFESAIAKDEAMGCPGAASLVRRDLARMLLARAGEGDLDRAAGLLVQPLRAAEAAGMEALALRVRAELERVESARRAVADPVGAPAIRHRG